MIISFIDDRGFHDSVTLSNKEIEKNPELLEWTLEQLWLQDCDVLEVWNPTMEETLKRFKAMQAELQKAQERHEEHQKIVDQALWRALDNDT